MNTAYNSESSKYLRNHPHEKITRFKFGELFNKAFIRVATPEKAIKGLQPIGIFRYNPDLSAEEDFENQLHLKTLITLMVVKILRVVLPANFLPKDG